MDKVILAFYVNVGNMGAKDVSILVERFKKEVQNDDLIQYFIPIREGESRVECVYPKYVVGEEVEKELEDVISKLNNHVKKLETGE